MLKDLGEQDASGISFDQQINFVFLLLSQSTAQDIK